MAKKKDILKPTPCKEPYYDGYEVHGYLRSKYGKEYDACDVAEHLGCPANGSMNWLSHDDYDTKFESVKILLREFCPNKEDVVLIYDCW